MNHPPEVFDESTPVVDEKKVNRAIAYASRLLGMREYSQKTLFDKITGKGFEREIAQQAIEFLKENNWLSDQRFCESMVRGKVAKGQGMSRISYELVQKGVAKSLVEDVLAEMNVDWQQVCNKVTAKKMAISPLTKDIKSRQKIERFLRYRGFTSSEIRRSIEHNLNNMGETTGEYD